MRKQFVIKSLTEDLFWSRQHKQLLPILDATRFFDHPSEVVYNIVSDTGVPCITTGRELKLASKICPVVVLEIYEES